MSTGPSYLILMMTCKTWGEFTQAGSLIEDETFLNCLTRIFGDSEVILKDEKVVEWHSKLQQPWLLNCDYLSDMCLEVIQKRMNLEVALFPRLQQCFGQNSGRPVSDGAIVTKVLVIGAGFFQAMPLG